MHEKESDKNGAERVHGYPDTHTLTVVSNKKHNINKAFLANTIELRMFGCDDCIRFQVNKKTKPPNGTLVTSIRMKIKYCTNQPQIFDQSHS